MILIACGPAASSPEEIEEKTSQQEGKEPHRRQLHDSDCRLGRRKRVLGRNGNTSMYLPPMILRVLDLLQAKVSTTKKISDELRDIIYSNLL